MSLRWAAAPLAFAIAMIAGAARAETTTVMCTYRAPQGHTLAFRFDVEHQVLIEGPDIFDDGTTKDAPLAITDDVIAWMSDDGSKMTLDRTTMVLAVTHDGIGPTDAFDCTVVHKQL